MMFATKRRLTAMLLIVGFLVASLAMFAPQTEGQWIANCPNAQAKCCNAIFAARVICAIFGSGSDACLAAQYYAGSWCHIASSICNEAFSCS